MPRFPNFYQVQQMLWHIFIKFTLFTYLYFYDITKIGVNGKVSREGVSYYAP